MDLLDHQFEVGGVVFGAGRPVEVQTWTPAGASWNSQDKKRPRQHGTRPGRDTRGVATWAFDAYTNELNGPDALAAVDELAGVWPTEEVAGTPGLMTPLRYAIGGRTRRVLGRPREFDAPIDTSYLQGMVPVTMNFVVMDPLFYDDAESVIEIDAAPETTGGLRSPLRSPLRSRYAPAPQKKTAVVGGTRPTWATVEFEGGSCTRPYLQAGNLWRVQLDATLAYDERGVIDGRPQSRAATKTLASAPRDTVGSPIAVTRGTRIAEMLLPPGRHVLQFGYEGARGAARARVRWRTASNSL